MLLFVSTFGFDIFGMSGKELCTDRKGWLLKAHQEIPNTIQTMNEGVERTTIIVFKALANDDYKKIDDQTVGSNFDNAVQAASQIASRIHTISQDSPGKFKPEWQTKKRATKYAKDTVELLNNPTLQEELEKKYSKKKLNALKKQYTKNKEQPASACWKPTNLPEKTTEEVFWNPASDITNQDDLDSSLRRFGIELSQESKDIEEQCRKIDEKKKKVQNLKQACLVWKREDAKRLKQATKDNKEHNSENKSIEQQDKQITEQQFSDSFARIIHYHNYALVRAAFYMKDLSKKKKDIPNGLHYLYQAQAIKNALFSLPEYHQAKNKRSEFYASVKHLGLADDLYIVHRFLADAKKYQSTIDRPLTTKEWIIDSCKIVKIILDDPSTIKSFFKPESMITFLNTDMMKKYVTDKRTLSFLNISSTCVGFFDKHRYLKAAIRPFGYYLVRPGLKRLLSFTENRLTSKKEEDKPSLLQNGLDNFVLSLKDEYQQTRNVSDVHSQAESYVKFLLKRTQLKDDSIAIPLSKDKAKKLKEESQKELSAIEKELAPFKSYVAINPDYKVTSEDEQILKKSTAEQEELKAEIKRANYWLQFHGEKVEKPTVSIVTPIDTVVRNHEQRKKELCDQSRKLYEDHLYDADKAQQELKKETSMYSDLLRRSKIFYAPEKFLFPNKDNKKQIRTFIKKHADEYRNLLTSYEGLLATLGIPTETFLVLYVKAKINEEYGAFIAHYDNVQEKFVQKVHERKHLEDEYEKLKKESETFMNRSFKAPKRLFSFIYSFLVDKYNQWRMNRNKCAQKQVNQEVETFRTQLRELKQHQTYQAFDQMFQDKTHTRYVQDACLEEKVKILANTCDSLFEFALWPNMRVKKQLAAELLKKRKHRTPFLQQPLTLPSFISIDVPVQNGKMDCALRSLINVNYMLENDQENLAYDEAYRERLETLRLSSEEESWLKEDTVKGLIDTHYQDKNLIFIPSVYYFKEMRSCLDRDTLEHLSILQTKLKSESDFSQGLVLGTMRQNGDIQNGGHCASGHYVALVFQRKKGNLRIKFANSMLSYSCDDSVITLLEVLKKYDFGNVVNSKDSTRVCDLLNQLDCRKIFVDKKLNQDIFSQKRSNDVMQNEKDIPRIIDDILNASSELLHLTNGQAMWTSSGFKDIKALILESLDALEHCHEKLIRVDPRGIDELMILNDTQKETSKVLRHFVKQI